MKANIDPLTQISKADSRIKFLTQEQVEQLAIAHDRVLVGDQSESAHSGAVKLLEDRVYTAEHEIEYLRYELAETREMLRQIKQHLTDHSKQISQLFGETGLLRDHLEPHQQTALALPRQVVLPDGLVTWHFFANQHGIAQNHTRSLIKSGMIHVVKGSWQTDQGTVKEALDEKGRQDFYIQFNKQPEFVRCDYCPHTKG